MWSNPLRRASASQQRLGDWLGNVAELAEVRLQLLALDARQEAGHLLLLAGFALAGALLLVFALAFAGVFFTVALWERHALAALGACTLLFGAGGAALLWHATKRLPQLGSAFAATRAELRADCQRLRAATATVHLDKEAP